MSQPYRIDIFEDLIYGTDLKHEVFRVHKYGKQPFELLEPAIEKATHVMIAHRFKQQDGKIIFSSQIDFTFELYLLQRLGDGRNTVTIFQELRLWVVIGASLKRALNILRG